MTILWIFLGAIAKLDYILGSFLCFKFFSLGQGGECLNLKYLFGLPDIPDIFWGKQ